MTENTMVIPPQGKRTQEIILKATFDESYEIGGEIDEDIAMLLGSFGVFG